MELLATALPQSGEGTCVQAEDGTATNRVYNYYNGHGGRVRYKRWRCKGSVPQETTRTMR